MRLAATSRRARPSIRFRCCSSNCRGDSLRSGRSGYLFGFGAGSLSDTTFTYKGVTYTIYELHLDPGFPNNPYVNNRLDLYFTPEADAAFLNNPLTLQIGTDQFRFQDAQINGGELNWYNSGLSWSMGDTVTVKLLDTANVGQTRQPLLGPTPRREASTPGWRSTTWEKKRWR